MQDFMMIYADYRRARLCGLSFNTHLWISEPEWLAKICRIYPIVLCRRGPMLNTAA